MWMRPPGSKICSVAPNTAVAEICRRCPGREIGLIGTETDTPAVPSHRLSWYRKAPMKTPAFHHIGLIAKDDAASVTGVIHEIVAILTQARCEVLAGGPTTRFAPTARPVAMPDLPRQADLIIVVGGDGSLLAAARSTGWPKTPLLGVNLGRLGFLADLSPTELNKELPEILAGRYGIEHRMLLRADSPDLDGNDALALNDVVVKRINGGHLLELELMIGAIQLGRTRADGLIVASPTGSTAYALSAGGPIVHPNLEALAIVHISPHSLGERPIMVGADQTVHIRPVLNAGERAEALLDGQLRFELKPGKTLTVQRSKNSVQLLHPPSYEYFSNLRKKLGWGGWRTPSC